MSLWSRLTGLFRRAPKIGHEIGHSARITAAPPPDLAKVLRAAGMADADYWARHLAEPVARFGIDRPRRLAAFAATIAHESAGGVVLRENLNYSVAGLMATWPNRFPPYIAEKYGRAPGKPADQQGIANYAYGGRMGNGPPETGDGWRYRGRSLIQLTGRDAYRRAGAALGLPLETDPELAVVPQNAALIAAWTWAAWKGCNAPADAENIIEWRRRINGGINGLEDVKRRYWAALAVSPP